MAENGPFSGQVTAICSLCDYTLGLCLIAVIYKLSSDHLTHNKGQTQLCFSAPCSNTFNTNNAGSRDFVVFFFFGGEENSSNNRPLLQFFLNRAI